MTVYTWIVIEMVLRDLGWLRNLFQFIPVSDSFRFIGFLSFKNIGIRLCIFNYNDLMLLVFSDNASIFPEVSF